MSKQDHESLCRRCARCCYEKYVVEERVFTTRRPCACLDVKTRLCRIYETRFEDNHRCVPVDQGIKLGVFPADCPYVQGLEGYVPSEEGWLEEEVVALIERGALLTAEDVRAEMRRRKRTGLTTERHGGPRRTKA